MKKGPFKMGGMSFKEKSPVKNKVKTTYNEDGSITKTNEEGEATNYTVNKDYKPGSKSGSKGYHKFLSGETDPSGAPIGTAG